MEDVNIHSDPRYTNDAVGTAALLITKPPLPQSDPVPLTTPDELTCRHCVDPVIGNVTVPLVTARFPFTVTGTLNVFAPAVSLSRKLVPFGSELIYDEIDTGAPIASPTFP